LSLHFPDWHAKVESVPSSALTPSLQSSSLLHGENSSPDLGFWYGSSSSRSNGLSSISLPLSLSYAPTLGLSHKSCLGFYLQNSLHPGFIGFSSHSSGVGGWGILHRVSSGLVSQYLGHPLFIWSTSHSSGVGLGGVGSIALHNGCSGLDLQNSGHPILIFLSVQSSGVGLGYGILHKGCSGLV